MRTYKIVKYQQGKNKKTGKPYLHYSITIPTDLAQQLPEGMQYQVELTDDGILLRPIGQANVVPSRMPAWAQQQQTDDGDEPAEPKNNTRKRPAARSKAAK